MGSAKYFPPFPYFYTPFGTCEWKMEGCESELEAMPQMSKMREGRVPVPWPCDAVAYICQ